jgi:eukaryotic-like serine/threonine-protein kinase
MNEPDNGETQVSSDLPPPAAPLTQVGRDLTGKVLGDFLVERFLGRGGMGEVYLARQISLNRSVALKVLRPDLASNPTYLSRFEVEATAVARLNHPNIVQAYTLGKEGDLRFIAMEYVQGTNLRDYLAKKGTLDAALALSLMRQTALAIAAAGEVGLIHRDIKPENLLLTRKGQVKVADFGLCREQGADALHLTQEGVTLGTPMYMSPEQVQGKPLDPRTDLYSMGVTFYHALAGQTPFRGETAVAVAMKHLQEVPVSLAVHRPDLPPELVAVITKLMAKKPSERFQSARELLRELARIREALALQTGVSPAAETQALAKATAEAPPATLNPARTPRIPSRVRIRGMRLGRRAIAVLAIAGLVLGAALGWAARVPDVLGESTKPTGAPGLWIEPAWQDIPRQPTAREQLRHAQVAVPVADRVAALLAVPGRFPKEVEWSLHAYAMLGRELLHQRDSVRLGELATSLAGGAADSNRLRQVSVIVAAGVSALDDKASDAQDRLNTLGNLPGLDPVLAELALEIAIIASNSPSGRAMPPTTWENLQFGLRQPLRLESLEPAESARRP